LCNNNIIIIILNLKIHQMNNNITNESSRITNNNITSRVK